jgi:hypothetical protein
MHVVPSRTSGRQQMKTQNLIASGIVAGFAMLTVAACSGGGDAAVEKAETAQTKGGAASGAQVAREMAEATPMEPGQYETRINVSRFEVPGMPAEQAAMMRQMMTSMSGAVQSQCVTAQQARSRGRDMFREMGRGDCTMENFNIDGEAVTGLMRCAGQNGSRAEMTMTGTMGSTASDMAIAMNVTDPSMPQGRMTMAMQVTATRTGECRPGASSGPAAPNAAPTPTPTPPAPAQ